MRKLMFPTIEEYLEEELARKRKQTKPRKRIVTIGLFLLKVIGYAALVLVVIYAIIAIISIIVGLGFLKGEFDSRKKGDTEKKKDWLF